jgi:hypothetical protein
MVSTQPLTAFAQPQTATAGFQPTIIPVRFISWVLPPSPPNPQPSGVPPSGTITADSVIEERYDDESIITENPVETGSITSDHAYDLPQELDVTYAWSAASPQAGGQSSFLNQLYDQVLALKQGKVLLTVSTGRRLYQNLLIKSISTISDRDTENILQLRLSLRQLILTTTQTVTTGQANQTQASQQLIPAKTMPTQNSGTVSLAPATNFNSGTPTGS